MTCDVILESVNVKPREWEVTCHFICVDGSEERHC